MDVLQSNMSSLLNINIYMHTILPKFAIAVSDVGFHHAPHSVIYQMSLETHVPAFSGSNLSMPKLYPQECPSLQVSARCWIWAVVTSLHEPYVLYTSCDVESVFLFSADIVSNEHNSHLHKD